MASNSDMEDRLKELERLEQYANDMAKLVAQRYNTGYITQMG